MSLPPSESTTEHACKGDCGCDHDDPDHVCACAAGDEDGGGCGTQDEAAGSCGSGGCGAPPLLDGQFVLAGAPPVVMPPPPPTARPTVDTDRWTRRALWLAWFTIAYNVVEGLAAVGFGLAEESLALLGFGVDSWVEVGAAVVVLWRLRGGAATARERRATTIIGGLLLALAVGVTAGSLIQLATGAHPDTTLPGVVISLLSLSFMYWLWKSKLEVARKLDSRALLADAACSRSCLQLSGVLLVGSGLYALAPALWWADGAAALVLAVLIGREGVESIRAARQPDFDGGCGCAH